MEIAVLGTGAVGRTIGSKLTELGHRVRMGSRTADNEKMVAWTEAEENGSAHTFADAAGPCEVVFNCTAGVASLDALGMAGGSALNGKLLIDVSNPLDFSQGMPPSLSVSNTDSLGEQIQRAFPELRVVKALNTMHCSLMVNPGSLRESHDCFICGDREDAKKETRDLLHSFGWSDANIIDLGGISQSRGLEQFLPLWVRLYGVYGEANFNIRVVRH